MMTLCTRILFCLMAITIGCGSVYNVNYDYDAKTDFARLKTYDWLPVPDQASIDTLNAGRIRNAVNAQLEAKGFTMSPEASDFSIAMHFIKKDKLSVRDWGYGYGFGRPHWGRRSIDVYQYEEGTLVLDFVDSKTKKLIWRGSAKAVMDDVSTPEKRQKLINEAVQKIFKKFPPPLK